jgi:hypothetical protein
MSADERFGRQAQPGDERAGGEPDHSIRRGLHQQVGGGEGEGEGHEPVERIRLLRRHARRLPRDINSTNGFRHGLMIGRAG